MTVPTASHVVGRVGALLRSVAHHEPEGAGTTTIARRAGLPRATAHRLLVSLAEEGILDRRVDTGHWFLGPEMFFWGAAAADRYDVTHLAAPSVHRLAEATQESAFFSARRGSESICLVREDGSFPIRSHVLHEGVRFPLGVASAGLVILAHLPDREVEAHLAAHDLAGPWGSRHRGEEVRERVRATRRTGYALNPGLVVAGSWGMGAAVFDNAGSPAWALSLTGIEQRFTPERQRDLGALLLAEAHRLGRRIAATDTTRHRPV